MATFEQALDKTFEVTWKLGKDVDRVHEKYGRVPTDEGHTLLVESVESAFHGAVNVLGSLLHLSGKIEIFEMSGGIAVDGTLRGDSVEWADGSSATLRALMDWGLSNQKVTHAEYTAWYNEQNGAKL